MRPLLPAVAVLASLAMQPASAAPRVAADIAPVHSLVARAMQGVGEPELILPPGADPHDYAMRPSTARMLSEAQLVFWVGEYLTPWLDHPLESLARAALRVELMEAPGVTRLAYGDDDHRDRDHDDDHARDDDRRHDDDHKHDDDDHKHDDDDDDHKHDDDDHKHDDDDDHKHDNDDDHRHDNDDDHRHDDDHKHDDDDHDRRHDDDDHKHDDDDDRKHAHRDHDHGDYDPHIWLDPANAKAMLSAIAGALSRVDPDNAARYAANAAAGAAEIDAASGRAEALLGPLRGKAFVTAHDAYAYFEHRFDFESAGSVALGDAATPGPAQLRRIRDTIRDRGAACVFIEPQLDPKLVRTAAEGSGARIATLDPVGSLLEPGPGLYPALIEGLARDLADCLGAQ